MRQINFLMIFIFCLALVLFSLENTDPATIQLTPSIQVQAPVSIELVLAMGVGAVLAWVFSMWTRLQRTLVVRQEIRQRDVYIQELEQNLKQYKTEQEQQLSLLPATATAQEAQ